MHRQRSSGRRISAGVLLSCLALMSITSCVHQNGGSQASATNAVACLAFQPIYLDDVDIAAISLSLAEKIAAHNLIWEYRCGAITSD